MIWIVLSLILAVILLFHEGQKSLRAAGDFVFTEISEFDFRKLFFAEGIKSLLTPSVDSNIAISVLQSSLKVRQFRGSTLRLAMSILALVPLLLWSNLVFAVNGNYIAGFAAILFLFFHHFSDRKIQILNGFVRFAFFAGVTLILMEQLMRLGSQLMMVAHDYEWIFVVSIGSLANGLTLFLMSFVLSFFIRLSGWSFIFSLALLLTGVLAFNNAILLIAGEMLALPWPVLFFLRGFSKSIRGWFFQYAMIHSIAALATAVLLIGFRTEIFVSEVGSLGQVEVRQQALLFVFMAFLVVPFVATMAWGHFASKVPSEEVEVTQVARLDALLNKIVSNPDLSFLQRSLEQRLITLEEQQLELKKQEYAGVPAPLLQKHKTELQTIKRIHDEVKRNS